jgi:hypothetical protein
MAPTTPNAKKQLIAPPTSSGKEDNNYKLLFAIISQLSPDGRLKGIDWNVVAADLGLERGAAASLRVSDIL